MIDGFYKVKSYWQKPPKGYQVSYKEVTNFTVGFSSYSMMSVLVQWTTIAVATPMMTSYFGVSSGLVALLGIVGSIITLLRAPLISMIMDNSRSKNGKFKPFLIWTMVVSALAFGLVPFIPPSWNANILFNIPIPNIAILGITADSVPFSMGVLIMFILVQLGTSVFQVFTQSMNGIENTISNVAQERANIGAIKSLLSNLPNSLINIVIPFAAAIFFTGVGFTKNNEGMLNINLYRIFFPVCAILSAAFVLFIYFGTKERAVVNKKYVNKVKFWEGAKDLSKNKYFWILTIYAIFIGIRGNSNISYYAALYSIGGVVGNSVWGICQMVLNNAFIPGMIFGPMLIKKLGKRNIMIASTVAFTVMVALQYLFLKNPYLILVGIFFQNLVVGVQFATVIMTSDVLDYQQMKTGKRLEGFWYSYTAFVTTLFGFITMFLEPIFMSFGGVSFGMKIQDAMTDPILRDNVYFQKTNLAMIGSVIAMLPMLFYDLTENKHKNIVNVLKIRKAVDNYSDGALEDMDVIELRRIVDEAREIEANASIYVTKRQKVEFENAMTVVEELKKYDCIDAILINFEQAQINEDARNKRVEMDILSRNIDLEEKVMLAIMKSKKNSAAKKKVEFNEDEYLATAIEKSRFVKQKDDLAKYYEDETELAKVVALKVAADKKIEDVAIVENVENAESKLAESKTEKED